MSIGKTAKPSVQFVQLSLRTLIVLLVFILTSCQFLPNEPVPKITETPFSESVVQEVADTIVSFETLWLSEQSHRDPIFQTELAKGKYLEQMRYANSNIQNELEWLVTEKAELEKLQLIEYSEQRFKAEACVKKSGKKIHPDGTVVGTFSDVQACGIYVFVKSEDRWKLLGYINTMDSRTYEHAPDWLKEIIGEVPKN